ncbi:hypothetical protein NPIL_267101 [Nephila pilipes]|uniref:Uncharacterized protein n=1 Tax=Nephila pilipes TaxID=299642 RepID=A0A8X6UBG6_NEPPI|nr:hypothetical protein NPIL_267101 [Nephila pilipes]
MALIAMYVVRSYAATNYIYTKQLPLLANMANSMYGHGNNHIYNNMYMAASQPVYTRNNSYAISLHVATVAVYGNWLYAHVATEAMLSSQHNSMCSMWV